MLSFNFKKKKQKRPSVFQNYIYIFKKKENTVHFTASFHGDLCVLGKDSPEAETST